MTHRPSFQIVSVVVMLLMRIASTPTANLSYLLLAAYAMFGRVQAIQALALSWLFSVISPGIAAEATQGTVGRYAVLFAAAGSVLLRSGSLFRSRDIRINRVVFATILLGIGIVLHTLLFSSMKSVSLLKSVSWTVACATLITAWSALSLDQRQVLAKQVYGGLVLVLVLSMPLLGNGLGYLVNGMGFQGVLNHPQAFGPTMAILGAWTMGRILTSPRPDFRMMGLFAACLVMIVLSEARTAGFALVLAILTASVVVQVLTRKRFVVLFPAIRSRRFQMAALLAFAVMLVAAPMLTGILQGYVAKRGGSTDITEAYERSRGGLIDQMVANIRKDPWRGVGFGVASEPTEMVVSYDPVLGLPVGASIEKGVLPLAVVEELGIPGALAVLAWIWLLVRRSIQGAGLVPLALLFTALLLNMGEMMLFSPGGMGLLLLVVIGLAASEKPQVRRHAGAEHG